MSQNEIHFQSKVYTILVLLGNNRKYFKNVASSTQDKELRKLASQFIQNDVDFSHQLSVLLPKNTTFISETEQGNDNLAPQHTKPSYFESCKNEERSLEKGYRDLLNISLLDEKIRNLFQHQLNKMKELFLKIEINDLLKSSAPYHDSGWLFFYKFIQ